MSVLTTVAVRFLIVASIVLTARPFVSEAWSADGNRRPSKCDLLSDLTEKYRCLINDLIRQAPRIQEPKVYRLASYRSDQKWTLTYHKRTGRLAEELDTLMNPSINLGVFQHKTSLLNVYNQRYVYYRELVLQILSELPKQLGQHIGMIRSPWYAEKYVTDYKSVLKSLAYTEPSQIHLYRSFYCEYTSQATNVLWFALNAAILLDKYALSNYGDSWAKIVQAHKSESSTNLNVISDQLAHGQSFF